MYENIYGRKTEHLPSLISDATYISDFAMRDFLLFFAIV